MAKEKLGTQPEAIRGWGCTPIEDLPSAVVSSDEQIHSSFLPTLLHRGWRRTGLYCILLILLVLVFLNIALTLWIITALKLSMGTIGPIKIINGGIQLTGESWFVGNLVASSIMSQTAHPITMHSHRNFSVFVSEPDHVEYSKLLIKRDRIECSGRTFQVNDARGAGIFHASRDEVKVFADTLNVDGAGGLVVKNAIQTPIVRAPHGSDLQLESLTRRLDLRAPKSIYLESRSGSIDITAHSDIKLDSAEGAVKFHASNIIIENLMEANITTKQQKNAWTKRIYQLCACASGKLFLTTGDSLCEARDDDTELCRY